MLLHYAQTQMLSLIVRFRVGAAWFLRATNNIRNTNADISKKGSMLVAHKNDSHREVDNRLETENTLCYHDPTVTRRFPAAENAMQIAVIVKYG